MNPAEMQDYKRAIGELQRDIEKDSTEIREYLSKLEEHLSYQEADALRDSAIWPTESRDWKGISKAGAGKSKPFAHG